MVISIHSQNIFDRHKIFSTMTSVLLNGVEEINSPDVTGGEFDGGQMTTHREPSEEPRRLSRDGNDVGVSSNSGPNGDSSREEVPHE